MCHNRMFATSKSADSTSKCNFGELSFGVEKHFIRCSVSRRLKGIKAEFLFSENFQAGVHSFGIVILPAFGCDFIKRRLIPQ